MALTFSYHISECDVGNRAILEAFRVKLIEWDTLLNGDEHHSIASQFGDMMWQDASWRLANEARSYANADGPNASVAPLLARMLDRGYVAGQVIAITRLLEPSNPAHPKKGVVSLRRIVDDIKANRALITRENFVAHDALPFDYEPVEQAVMAEIAARAVNAGGVTFEHMDTTGPMAFDMAKQQHEQFDKIAETQGSRNRGDLIADSFFDRIESLLGDPLFGQIKDLRNKSIAHAADAFSRSQATGLRGGLTLNEFERAQYLLFAVYQTLSVILLGQWRAAAVPVAQHNILEHLDGPFILEARHADARAYWEKHCEEREAWMQNAFREIVSG